MTYNKTIEKKKDKKQEVQSIDIIYFINFLFNLNHMS